MPSNKRAREVARAKAERQRQRRAEREAQRRRRTQIIAAVAVLAVVIGGVVWFALSRPSTPVAGDVTVPTPSASPTEEPTGEASPDPSGDPTTEPTDGPTDEPTTEPTEPVVAECGPAPQTRPDDLTWPEAPTDVLAPDTDYTLRLDTNCGRIDIATEPEAAPETVASMVFLTEEGYFDLTACHRLTTEGIYVLQCGDPAGDGTGGPGYTVPDENLPTEGASNYPAGTVAMANAGPGTAGSQFFIVYQDTTLPAAYTIWGTVTRGLDVVQAVADAGVAGGGTDGPPAQPVVIETARVVTR